MENFNKFVYSCPEFNYLTKNKNGDSLLEWISPYFQVGNSLMKWVGVQGLGDYCIQELMDGKKIRYEQVCKIIHTVNWARNFKIKS